MLTAAQERAPTFRCWIAVLGRAFIPAFPNLSGLFQWQFFGGRHCFTLRETFVGKPSR